MGSKFLRRPQTNDRRNGRTLFTSIRGIAEALTRAMDGASSPSAYSGWEVPKLRDADDEIVVSVRLPGVLEEDVRINVAKESVTIFAERDRARRYKGRHGHGVFTHTLTCRRARQATPAPRFRPGL